MQLSIGINIHENRTRMTWTACQQWWCSISHEYDVDSIIVQIYGEINVIWDQMSSNHLQDLLLFGNYPQLHHESENTVYQFEVQITCFYVILYYVVYPINICWISLLYIHSKVQRDITILVKVTYTMILHQTKQI